MSDTYLLLDNIDLKNPDIIYKQYYCANVVEQRYGKCENQLLYKKGGGFGLNYRYCSSCYNKWWKEEKEQKFSDDIIGKGKCLVILK
jgi:hypothetical protein